MSDNEKGKHVVSRNDSEFERICREELAAGETVVVARPSAVCTSPFPCLADMYVFAGLDEACPACEPHVQKMRDMEGWERQGEFWTSKDLTPEQQRFIQGRINRRQAR